MSAAQAAELFAALAFCELAAIAYVVHRFMRQQQDLLDRLMARDFDSYRVARAEKEAEKTPRPAPKKVENTHSVLGAGY